MASEHIVRVASTTPGVIAKQGINGIASFPLSKILKALETSDLIFQKSETMLAKIISIQPSTITAFYNNLKMPCAERQVRITIP